MAETAVIPFTAWEQAGFVCLVIVLVIWLLTWSNKQQANWQNYIAKQNELWQKFLRDQNQTTSEAMKEVTEALANLGKKIDAHDAKVETRMANMNAPGPVRKPRAKE